ncbi:hypothetical protein ACIPY3_09440 [Paenarthrobacter sp. NPDC089714]|uniref:hypothetical protein n=1 Tax=Paenarthrobacter sp. NPDC089714 TaxID=3364377 RepID=UPI00382827B2
MRELIVDHPHLRQIYRQLLEDNYGDLLPHLLMAEVCKWAVAEQESNPVRVLQLLSWLEAHLACEGRVKDDVDNVIAVSFIEHLPLPSERPDADVVLLLGPSMKTQYEQFFPSRTDSRANVQREEARERNPSGPAVTVTDLSFLHPDLQKGALRDPNGEVSWPAAQAPAVIEALTGSGRLVLGLDVRDYQSDGTFIEEPLWSYKGSDVQEAHVRAITAIGHGDLPGEWVLITW